MLSLKWIHWFHYWIWAETPNARRNARTHRRTDAHPDFAGGDKCVHRPACQSTDRFVSPHSLVQKGFLRRVGSKGGNLVTYLLSIQHNFPVQMHNIKCHVKKQLIVDPPPPPPPPPHTHTHTPPPPQPTLPATPLCLLCSKVTRCRFPKNQFQEIEVKHDVARSFIKMTFVGAMVSQITSLTIVYSTVYSRRRSKKTSKHRVTGLCAGNSPVTGEFPGQKASNAENVSIWWRHHVLLKMR